MDYHILFKILLIILFSISLSSSTKYKSHNTKEFSSRFSKREIRDNVFNNRQRLKTTILMESSNPVVMMMKRPNALFEMETGEDRKYKRDTEFVRDPLIARESSSNFRKEEFDYNPKDGESGAGNGKDKNLIISLMGQALENGFNANEEDAESLTNRRGKIWDPEENEEDEEGEEKNYYKMKGYARYAAASEGVKVDADDDNNKKIGTGKDPSKKKDSGEDDLKKDASFYVYPYPFYPYPYYYPYYYDDFHHYHYYY